MHCGVNEISNVWVNRDPLGDESFRSHLHIASSRKQIDRNLYLFVTDDPMNLIDPLGLDKTPWPLNGQVCNCKDNDKPVYVLVDGHYSTLPSGQCTASSRKSFDDVDGVWIGGKFYKVGCSTLDTCHPPTDPCGTHLWNKCDKCPWDGMPGSPTSPHGRGAPDDSPPSNPPPPYVPPTGTS